MADRHNPTPLNPDRKAPLGALAVGAAFLGIFHLLVDKLPGPFKLLEVLGSLFVVLGIGGVIDPRYFYGVADQSQGVYPKPIRAISTVLVIAGFGLGVFLLTAVYRVWP